MYAWQLSRVKDYALTYLPVLMVSKMDMTMTDIKFLALATFVLITSNFPKVTQAADVYTDGKITIHLDGEIRRGDAERVAIAVTESKHAATIVVSSLGGDINETMKIVSIVKGAHLNVRVAKGKFCASSCFFVYLAGLWRDSGIGVNDDGTLMPQEKRDRWSGVVGIHRPYFKDPSGNPESQRRQIELMRKVKTYLAEEGVGQYLIDEMMSHPSNDIYWLKDHDIDAIGEYAPDIEETIIAKCGYKRFSKTYEENWSEEKANNVMDCVTAAIYEKVVPLQNLYSVKLRTGWRPWKK